VDDTAEDSLERRKPEVKGVTMDNSLIQFTILLGGEIQEDFAGCSKGHQGSGGSIVKASIRQLESHILETKGVVLLGVVGVFTRTE